MSKYFVGIDSSTACTGIVILDENDKLVVSEYCSTKDKVKDTQSLGQEFQIIYNELSDCIEDITKKIYQKDSKAMFDIAIEYNSFGGYKTTALLSTVVGIVHAICAKYMSINDIKYSAVGNWRSKILGTDPEEDLSNNGKRNTLKIALMNWYERFFNVKLPNFPNKSDGIKKDDGTWDIRINDIADAAGLAYCCKYNLTSDRKQLRIETKRMSNKIRTFKAGFANYKARSLDYYSRYSKDKTDKLLSQLIEHLKTTEIYYNRLKETNSQTMLMEKWMNKKYKEIKDEVDKVLRDKENNNNKV